MIEKYTNFEYGFNFKGKRRNDVGEDVIGTYIAPESWTMPVYSGTPVDIDPNNEGQLKKTADGEKPEFLLYTRVSDELTDIEMYEDVVMRDEIPAGNPVEIVRFAPSAMISTKLIADSYTPSVGDALYVASGKFQNTDPTGDSSGVVVGEVKAIMGDYVRVVLK